MARNALIMLAILTMGWTTSHAQSHHQPPVLEHYLQLAAQDNPELQARFQEYLASLELAPQVATLPDPELAFGYFISPIETRVGPQQARFSISQMFPWFGTLQSRETAAAQQAKAQFEQFRETRNRLFFRVQKAWYDLYAIDRNIELTRKNIDILATFERIALQRYENMQGSQSDVLQVQIERDDLDTRLARYRDTRTLLEQQLNELMNRPDTAGVPVTSSLEPVVLERDRTELRQLALNRNPGLNRLNYLSAARQTQITTAEKEGLPKLGVGFDYILTGDRDVTGLTDNGRDALLARASISIPLFRKRDQAREEQARLQYRAAEQREASARNTLLTDLQRALRDYRDATRRHELYDARQIERTRQTINILMEEYSAAGTDFEEILRLQRKLLDYQLAREQSIAEQRTAIAYIDYLSGRYNVDPEELNQQN